MTYKLFRMAVGRKEIPETVAIDAYSDIEKLDFDSHLIMIMFDDDNEPYIFRIDEKGDAENCESFAAIGTGSTIAESVLFQRQHECDDPLGPSVYHVFEAMKLGSIASDVSQDKDRHTINILYPPGEKGDTVSGDWIKPKTTKWLERQFKKYGPKQFQRLPLPKNPFEKDF